MTIVNNKTALIRENGGRRFPCFLHQNIMRAVRYEKWKFFVIGGFAIAGGGVIGSIWYGWSTIIETGTADILRDIWGELTISYDMIAPSITMIYDDLSLGTVTIFTVSILIFSWLLSIIVNQSIRRPLGRMHYTLIT